MAFKEDQYYMRLALREASKGLGNTSPNPPVGAVVVEPKTGKVISKGYHRAYGLAHAERVALEKAGEKARGAHLYVTLEPCCHYGRTPPCTLAILEAGIKRVVCGIRDPNPLACNGLEHLRKQGVEVAVGILAEEVKYLTRFFLSHILRKRPWVMAKVAQSLDGRIAVSTGDSKWISGERARVFAHKLRSMVDAIVVGRDTILKDDPELTTRLVKGKNPLRIVLASQATLSTDFRVFQVEEDKRTILVCGEEVSEERLQPFRKRGVEIWKVPLKQGHIDLQAFLKRAHEEKISSLLIEGGARIHGAFLREGYIDEVYAVIAPLIMGDPQGIFSFQAKTLHKLSESHRLYHFKSRKLGDCFLLHGITKEGLNLLNSPLEFP